LVPLSGSQDRTHGVVVMEPAVWTVTVVDDLTSADWWITDSRPVPGRSDVGRLIWTFPGPLGNCSRLRLKLRTVVAFGLTVEHLDPSLTL